MKGLEKYQTSCMSECVVGKEEQEKAMEFRLLSPTCSHLVHVGGHPLSHLDV